MYVFYNVPLYREAASPFIHAPKVHVILVVNRANHLSNTTEMETFIDRKEKENWAQGTTTCRYSLSLSECNIQLHTLMLSFFLIALSIKSSAKTFLTVLASSPVKQPIPAPSSRIDVPSSEGSKNRTLGQPPCPERQGGPLSRLTARESSIMASTMRFLGCSS